MLLRVCLLALLASLAAAQFQAQQRQSQGLTVFERQRQAIRRTQQRRVPSFNRVRTTTTTTTTTTTQAPEKPQGGTQKKAGGQLLVPPVPELCASRAKHWQLNGHWYFYSADEPEYQTIDEKTGETIGKRYNWLEARNLCRKYCMDSIGIESEDEWEMVQKNITDRGIIYVWSSGRLCDFKGCESREDLKPFKVNGWFWSDTNVKIAPTNKIPPGWSQQPWSQTGHKKLPQPDNAEFDINQTNEPCLGLLNGIYDDGVSWHDIACYHRKPVFCEDNKVLLEYARAINRRDNLGLVID